MREEPQTMESLTKYEKLIYILDKFNEFKRSDFIGQNLQKITQF